MTDLSARTWIAEQIRSKVIAADPAEALAAHQAMTMPGPRWFAEDRAIRLVHADSAMFVGGLRALLLQSLHPLAMAGVAEHSEYRSDPWGRLQRTAHFLAATTYGPADLAEEAVATVRRVHRHVHGWAPDGRPYSANDPHLLAWVHLVEIDSFLAAYRRYGSRPLTTTEADEYIADSAVIARKLGVESPPTSVSEMRKEMRTFRPELAGTTAARQAARFLLLDPPLPLAARGPYALLAASAVALLPRWARWPLRLPYLPVTERVVVRPAGAAVSQLIRWSLGGAA